MVNLGPHKTLLNSITGNPVVPRECEYGCNTKFGDDGFVTDSCPKHILPPAQQINNGIIIFNIVLY